MGVVSTILGFSGFGFGFSAGIVIGYFIFIYVQPTDVKDVKVRPIVEYDSKSLEAIFPEIPMWDKNPDYDRIDWLNRFVELMWPFLDKAICRTAQDIAKPIIAENTEKYKIDSVEFESLTLGSLPPTFQGMKVYVTEEQELIMEPSVKWAANPNITVVVKAYGLKATIQIVDLQAFASPRITLKPLVPTFPCFAKILVSLMEKPHADFGLKLLGADLMAIPGLYRFVQDDSSDGDSTVDSSDEDSIDQDDYSSDEQDEEAMNNRVLALLELRRQRLHNIGMIVNMFGTYYIYRFMDKGERRILMAKESGYDWVLRTLGHRTDCYKMFRMYRPVFDKLHNVLVESYGLKSTKKMSSVESLALFLWIVGAPQSVRQAENRFVRSMETISRKFHKVLECVVKLSVDIIKPRDPEFRGVHERLTGAQWYPWFNDCIGAIDGTHVQVVVPPNKVPQYLSRHGYCSQNVMAVCDFDMRFTFVLAGWPGSVHDMKVFKDALSRFGAKFPRPPSGKFYLVDSGYPNKLGYLAPYRGQKYHFQEFHQGTMPRGKKEHFNYTHSRLRNVIERSFGVLKNKWRILFKIPSYPVRKQAKIIVACMALNNFIRESHMADKEFDRCDNDENYQPLLEETRRRRRKTSGQEMEADTLDMNQLRDRIADGLFNRR